MFCRLAPLDCYSEDAKGLSDGRRALLGERSAQVFEVARAHFIEHLYFFLVYTFEDVLVIERLEEGRFRLPT